MSQPAARQIDLPRDYRLRKTSLTGRSAIILVVLSLVLQSLTQEPVNWSWLGWVCLVPWAVAAAGYTRRLRGFLLFYLSSVAYFLFNLSWLIPITGAGWFGLGCYLGLYYLLCGFILQQVYLKRRWPFTLVLPVLWAGQEYLRGVVLTGFPWLFLAHGQHDHLALIQVADLTGTYGVTFIVAMVNGWLCDLLLRPLSSREIKKHKPLSPLKLGAITSLSLIGVLLYGRYRLAQSQQTMQPGPAIAVIQETFPQVVKESGDSSETLFQAHLKLTEAALAAEPRPDLIVWPETVAPPLNPEYLNYKLPGHDTTALDADIAQARQADETLSQTARQQGVGLLVGTPHLELRMAGDYLQPARQANAALLYLPDGSRFKPVYWKMHLVPFGEVVPFKRSIPWLFRLLNRFTPYDYDYSIDAGQDPVEFIYRTPDDREVRFAVAICYEDVIARVPPRLLQLDHRHSYDKKQIGFIVNISNDGWYLKGGRDGKPLTPTAELTQHLAICRFRAVENRVGIARAVNGGISGFIRPDGSLHSGGLVGTLPDDPWARQATSGFVTDRVLTDHRITFYSRFGDLFGIANAGLSALFVLLTRSRKHH